MPRPIKTPPMHYGEIKKPWQFMLTEEASESIDQVAEELGITRSEVVERAIRSGGLNAALKIQSVA